MRIFGGNPERFIHHANPFGAFAKERAASREDYFPYQDLIVPCGLSVAEGEEQVGPLVGFVGIVNVLDQDIPPGPGLVRTK